MTRMSVGVVAAVLLLGSLVRGDEGFTPFNEKSKDKRLEPARNLNGYFPMTVPATKEAWEKRRQDLREQLLVVNGLWPMPEKTPLNPTIHGKIDRDDYT